MSPWGEDFGGPGPPPGVSRLMFLAQQMNGFNHELGKRWQPSFFFFFPFWTDEQDSYPIPSSESQGL